jgi:hypothetical protein
LGKDRKEFGLGFPPHSFTTHELTLMSAVLGCVDTTKHVEGWSMVKDGVELVFSVPETWLDRKGLKDLDQCWLQSLEIKTKE